MIDCGLVRGSFQTLPDGIHLEYCDWKAASWCRLCLGLYIAAGLRIHGDYLSYILEIRRLLFTNFFSGRTAEEGDATDPDNR